MNAKEKAKDLVFDSFRKGIGVSNYHLKHDPSNLFKAKKCALICADEIIKILDEVSIGESGTTKIDYGQSFWQMVKLEIEKF